MLLVIPAIEIMGGRCAQMVQGIEGHKYSDDPVEMARLCRLENAKSLHVTDVDGRTEGRLVNGEVVRRIVQNIDIPVELGGGLGTFEMIREAFELGVYRVVAGIQILEADEVLRRVLGTFGPSKIVLGIDAVDGMVMFGGASVPAVTVARNAKEAGFKRLLYTEIRPDMALRGLNLKVLRELGEVSGLRITSSGGITGLDDLLNVQELERFGVDSVIVGRALYENRFSCQRLWRLCEAGNYPYTAKV